MWYKFPSIEHIDQVRAAIAGADEFIEVGRSDHIIFDYRFVTATSFPDVGSTEAALRREARGLIFDRSTGKVLGRRFHKFFNIGERDETRPDRVDLGRPHVMLEKLDGSMVSPIRPGGRLTWTTMLGETDVAAGAARFVADRPQFTRLAEELLAAGANPIFEWCSLENRVVVEHGEPALTLLAIRDLVSGSYWSFDAMREAAARAGVPVVAAWEGLDPNPQTLPQQLDALTGREGIVLRFDDGHMLKLKTPWYVRIHSVLERLSREPDAVEILLSGSMDDVLPFLPAADAQALRQFSVELDAGLSRSAGRLKQKLAELQARHSSRKEIAIALGKDPDAPFIFRMLDGGDTLALVRDHVLRECQSAPRLEAARRLFEARWTRPSFDEG
jgi:T4 RnlA family RNA ligase